MHSLETAGDNSYSVFLAWRIISVAARCDENFDSEKLCIEHLRFKENLVFLNVHVFWPVF